MKGPYYSLWDRQCNQYLHSGRDSRTKGECAAGGMSFLAGDWEPRELDELNKMSLKEKISLLDSFDLVIEEHPEPIDDPECR